MKAVVLAALSLALIAATTGCETRTDLNQVLGLDHVNGPQGPIPPGIDPSTGAGTGCDKGDPNHICLAVKYVVYSDEGGKPVLDVNQVNSVMREVNALWSQCNLSFKVEHYVAAQPRDYALRYNMANYSELSAARNTFLDRDTLLVITTGKWNRSGTLGNTGANAWAQLPGDAPYGVVLEQPVGANANLVAHELGHYLNLLHVSDSYALMNATIYGRSQNIYTRQCNTARSAAKYYWSRMIR